MADEWANRIVRRTRARAEAEAGRIVSEARAKWPVGAGRGKPHSKDLFVVKTRIDARTLRITVENSAKYAKFIHGDPWKRLIEDPLRERAAKIVGILAEETVNAVQRG